MPPPSSAGSTSPAGREVAAGFVATFLELTDRRGLDRASLTHGLVLSEPGRPRPFARIPWDDYAALLERVEAEVGSSGVEAIAEEMIQGSRFFTSLASRLVDVEALLRFGFERLFSSLELDTAYSGWFGTQRLHRYLHPKLHHC